MRYGPDRPEASNRMMTRTPPFETSSHPVRAVGAGAFAAWEERPSLGPPRPPPALPRCARGVRRHGAPPPPPRPAPPGPLPSLPRRARRVRRGATGAARRGAIGRPAVAMEESAAVGKPLSARAGPPGGGGPRLAESIGTRVRAAIISLFSLFLCLSLFLYFSISISFLSLSLSPSLFAESIGTRGPDTDDARRHGEGHRRPR